jgi:hypothetical protein
MESGFPRQSSLFYGERGVALMAVVLVASLVVGLVLMALTNSTIGRFLTSTHRQQKAVFSCAEGDLEVVTLLLTSKDVYKAANAVGTFVDKGGAQQAVIWVDPAMAGGDTLLADFSEELQSADLAGDDVETSPDMKIQNQNAPDCVTSIDVDYLGRRSSRGNYQGAAKSATGYHEPGVMGMACPDGLFYAITAVTQGPNQFFSRVQSGFYMCPST